MSEYPEPTAAQLIQMFQAGQLNRDQFFGFAQALSEDEMVKLADLLLRWVNPPNKTE
jgi:hypothetical protein